MIESRKDSESIYIDIVRHITLNMRSELGSRCVQRHTLLKGILSSVSHQVIQPLVWQALFLDWLYFDPKLLPLYEPGYQLLFHAVDQQPQFSARLIEFVYHLVKTYDSTRTSEYFLSVSKVLHLCESHQFVPQKVTFLINHPRLYPEIQKQLKELYTAVKAEQRMSASATHYDAYYKAMGGQGEGGQLVDAYEGMIES